MFHSSRQLLIIKREEVAILVGAGSVRLALVPDDAAEAVADRRLEHTVVDVGGAMIAAQRVFGALRLGEGPAAFRFGLLGRVLPVGQRLLFPKRAMASGSGLSCCSHRSSKGLYASSAASRSRANPGLAGRAAPGVVDQADRYVERFLQLPAEEVADGRERLDGLGVAHFPLAVEVGLRLLRPHLGTEMSRILALFAVRLSRSAS